MHLQDRMRKKLNVIDVEITPEYRLEEAKLINNLTFDDMEAEERRLKFEVKRDEDAIKKIQKATIKAREYLFEVQEMHLRGYFTDAELPILSEIEEI